MKEVQLAESEFPGLRRFLRPNSEFYPLYCLALLFGLICILVLVDLYLIDGWGASALIAVVSAITIVGPLWGATKLLAGHSRYLYLPITGFFVSCAIYHGIGTLLYSVGSAVGMSEATMFFSVNPEEMLRVQLLNSTCITFVIVGYLILNRIFGSFLRRSDESRTKSYAGVGTLMYGIGVAALYVKYRVALPWELKLVATPPAGVLVGLGVLSYGTDFYIWNRVGRNKSGLVLPLVFTLLDMGYGLASLYKASLLLPVIAGLLGYHASRPMKLKTWGKLFVAGILVLMVIQPINTYLRFRRSRLETVTMSSAIEDIKMALDPEAISELIHLRNEGVSKDTAWSRTAYFGFQAQCMRLWDEGKPGSSYAYIKEMLIPRWIWPDKPIVNPGVDFAINHVGVDNVSLGVTLFGEAFFNLGWFGVVLLGIWLPFFFIAFEFPVSRVLSGSNPEWAAILFAGVYIGIRVDDWAVMMTGQFLVAPILLICLTILRKICSSFFLSRHHEVS